MVGLRARRVTPPRAEMDKTTRRFSSYPNEISTYYINSMCFYFIKLMQNSLQCHI